LNSFNLTHLDLHSASNTSIAAEEMVLQKLQTFFLSLPIAKENRRQHYKESENILRSGEVSGLRTSYLFAGRPAWPQARSALPTFARSASVVFILCEPIGSEVLTREKAESFKKVRKTFSSQQLWRKPEVF